LALSGPFYEWLLYAAHNNRFERFTVFRPPALPEVSDLPFAISHCSNPDLKQVCEVSVFTLIPTKQKDSQHSVRNGKWQMENTKLEDEALFGAKLPTKSESSRGCQKVNGIGRLARRTVRIPK
jgi:hypothetical protein